MSAITVTPISRIVKNVEVTKRAKLSVITHGRVLATCQEVIEATSKSDRAMRLRLHNPIKAKPILVKKSINAEVTRSFKLKNPSPPSKPREIVLFVENIKPL